MARLSFTILSLSLFLSNSYAVDPAELFPANTIAYFEIRQPSKIADSWAQIVKGTSLDGSLATAADRRDRSSDLSQLIAIEMLGRIGLLASPEVRLELKRLGGIACGVTGLNEHGDPEYAVVVLFHESHLTGLMARSLLTTNPDVRRVKTIGEVSLFQIQTPPPIIPGPDGRPQPFSAALAKPDVHRSTMALTKELFVLGSSLAAVESILQRFSTKPNNSLAETQLLKSMADQRSNVDCFGVIQPSNWLTQFKKVKHQPAEDDHENWLQWLRLVLQPESMKSIVLTGQLAAEGWTINAVVDMNEGTLSPLLDVIRLQSIPKTQANAQVTFSFADQGAIAVLPLADAIGKAQGIVGRLPSDVIKRAEKTTGIKWQTELFPSIESISWGRDQNDHFISFAVKNSAEIWDNAWPGLFRAFGNDEQLQKPSIEEFQGLSVQSFATPTMIWPTIHVARVGNQIAFGTSRAAVVKGVKSEFRLLNQVASVFGEVRLDWLLPHEKRLPDFVRIPFLPTPGLDEIAANSPPIQFTAKRIDPKRINIAISQLGWSQPVAKNAITDFVLWLEKNVGRENTSRNPNELPLSGLIK